MVENGYTEYNTAAAFQRRQMIDIYIFSFCFAPPLNTSITLYRVNDNNLQVHYYI
jgi:hypothetical protein